jgi:hypothetical protein
MEVNNENEEMVYYCRLDWLVTVGIVSGSQL